MKIAVWPDGVWCEEEEIEEFLTPPCAKSDDFRILEVPDDVGDIDEWVQYQEV